MAKGKPVDKLCERCGLVLYDVDPRTKYCPECKRIVQKAVHDRARKRRRESDKEILRLKKADQAAEKPVEKIAPKPPIMSLDAVVKAAHAAHMSYGEYVAKVLGGGR